MVEYVAKYCWTGKKRISKNFQKCKIFIHILDVLILSELMQDLRNVIYKFGKLDISHYIGIYTGCSICFGPFSNYKNSPTYKHPANSTFDFL